MKINKSVITDKIQSFYKLNLLLYFLFSFHLWAALPAPPDNLRCFDKTNPAGTDEKPYFGWYFNDPDDDEIQTAFQILVASDENSFNDENEIIWNSGKVMSGSQNYVYYNGKPLSPAKRYYWKVRTWDKDGNAGPYSETSYFDSGLFTIKDWNGAKWIKRDTDDADDYTYYRDKIKLPAKTIRRAIVYVTACHNYELYINGTLIGKGPAYHYPQYQYYNGFDITSLVKSDAQNILACLTHWYGAGQGRPAASRGFLMKVVIEYSDATSTILGTDNSWKQKQADYWLSGQRPRNGEGIGYIDKMDATKIIPGWKDLDFDDSSWLPATEIGPLPVEPWTDNLQPDLTRLIENKITPYSVANSGAGKYVIDLGKVYAGVPMINFSGGKSGDIVKIRGGYTLNEDGTVSTATTQNTNMSYSYVIDGRESVFSPMVYLGMRYIQIDNSPNPLTTENVKFISRHYEMDPANSSFKCSNDMLNQVWNLMTHSLLLGAQEQFVDTPTREKGGFLGDSWSQAVPAMTVMGDRAMNLRVLQEFLDSQDQYWPDGRLNAVYPNGDGKRDIPDYTQSYLVWVWDYYMQTGNLKFLKDNYDKLKAIAEYVDSYRNENSGLIDNLAGGSGPYQYGIIDWPSQMRYDYDMSVESRTVIDSYAYIDYKILAEIAAVLSITKDQNVFDEKARDMKEAINSRLINEQGMYIDGLNSDLTQSTHVSQHANMFPLALGIVPKAHRTSVITAIKERQMSCGMVTLRWLPEAIGQAEEGDFLLELYTNTDWDGWAKTIRLGGTATWESWDALTSGQSMSHPWGVVGLLGIQEYILGIKAIRPQHELIQVKPLDFGSRLKFAKGTMPTDRGDINIDWQRGSKRYSMRLSIPDNVKAKVYLPKCGSNDTKIKVDGKDVTGKAEGNYIFIENIGSGTHIFERSVMAH